MARHYSTRDFFRQMPNQLLARYFHARGVFGDLDFTTMNETLPEELFKAWLELPQTLRNEIDAEFREIFEMSDEKGFKAIMDEATWHLTDDSAELTTLYVDLSELNNHFERAMIAFLDHHEFWEGAVHFHHADILTRWRKRKNLQHFPAAVDEGSLRELANLIRKHFHLTEGRGKNCIVEPFRRGELDYFFAYPEDYSQQSVEWVDGKFARRPHNPAFEVIYVYSQKEGSLDINYRGPLKAIEPLQEMFATAILKLSELPADPKDNRVYDLNPLRQSNFDFTFSPSSGILDVAIKKLRLSSKVKAGNRITLEVDALNDPGAIYDLLDTIAKATPLHLYNVTQAEIVALVDVEKKRPKSVTIRLTYPNSCSLKHDGIDMQLRKMLADSGIEPKEPTAGNDEEVEEQPRTIEYTTV